MDILGLLRMFANDGRVKTLAALILIDVVLGIAAAIKSGVFDIKKVGQFYKTMVIPYVLGYLAIWGAGFLLDPEWLGGAAWIASEAMQWAPWAALIASLAGSILANLQGLGIAVPPEEPPV